MYVYIYISIHINTYCYISIYHIYYIDMHIHITYKYIQVYSILVHKYITHQQITYKCKLHITYTSTILHIVTYQLVFRISTSKHYSYTGEVSQNHGCQHVTKSWSSMTWLILGTVYLRKSPNTQNSI